MQHRHDHRTLDAFAESQSDNPCSTCEQLFKAQRTALHRQILKWQREFFAQQVETKRVTALLKLHRDATQQIASERSRYASV